MAVWRIVFDLLGWAFLVLKIMYDRWPSFYLTTTRLWYWMTNPEVVWDMSILFHGDFAQDALDKVVEAMSSRDKDFVFKANTPFRKELWLRRTLFEITSYSDPAEALGLELGSETKRSIHVQMREKEVTYRTSLNCLDRFLAPMLEAIERSLSPSATTYSLSVVFQKPNPFFGLYVRRLKLAHIADFRVTFDVKSGGSGTNVKILKDVLQITTSSRDALMMMSRKYLCLSSGGIE